MEQMKNTVNDTEYTYQKVSPREWLRLKGRSKNKHGQVNEETFYTEILKHIVVNPKVTLDDFDDVKHLEEVVAPAVRFQQGKTEADEE